MDTAAPSPESPKTTVALLALPESSAATLFGFFDVLASARRDWAMLHGGAEVPSPFRPLVVSRDGAPLIAGNGVRITPDASLETVPPPDVICVTDLMVPPGQPLGDRYDVEAAWMRSHHARGAWLASACSGAVLLARTGLLDDCDATSHWAYCDTLSREYPRTRWHGERGLISAGADRRILMAGSGVAWHMLALSLVARHAGPNEAVRVARVYLMDLDGASPQAYASLTHGAAPGDPVVAAAQAWAAMNYQKESPVAQMVARSGLPERSFKRRFTQAVGMSPLEYVHTVRLEEAKQMLESSELAVESIALEVGYQDASFFGRLFRRKVSLTPAQYRRRFGGLARRLGNAASST